MVGNASRLGPNICRMVRDEDLGESLMATKERFDGLWLRKQWLRRRN